MLTHGVERCLTETRRRDVFRLLVSGQDLEMTVPESRQMVMDIFGLTEVQVIEVEMEGIRRRWLPPLPDCASHPNANNKLVAAERLPD